MFKYNFSIHYLPSTTTGLPLLGYFICGICLHLSVLMLIFDRSEPSSRYSTDLKEVDLELTPPTTMIPWPPPDNLTSEQPCFLLLVSSVGPWNHLTLTGSKIWTLTISTGH